MSDLYFHAVVNYLQIQKQARKLALFQNKRFCADVKKLSPLYQTSACEAFHSVVIHYAPKSTAFSYNGMLSRYAMLFVGCYISSFHNSLKVVLRCLALQ